MKKIIKLIVRIIEKIIYPNITISSWIDFSVKIYNRQNLYMEENTNIDNDAIIMNTRAKFIMKKNSGAAFGLVIVTGNHMSIIGIPHKKITDDMKNKLDINKEYDKDIIVEEDVWIANHVTLLSGVTIGRGSIVGAGSVVRRNVPPYSIVIGNPAKIIGFKFNPEEIIEHEKVLYQEKDRLPIELLNKNYEKYFLKRIKEIKQYTSL